MTTFVTPSKNEFTVSTNGYIQPMKYGYLQQDDFVVLGNFQPGKNPGQWLSHDLGVVALVRSANRAPVGFEKGRVLARVTQVNRNHSILPDPTSYFVEVVEILGDEPLVSLLNRVDAQKAFGAFEMQILQSLTHGAYLQAATAFTIRARPTSALCQGNLVRAFFSDTQHALGLDNCNAARIERAMAAIGLRLEILEAVQVKAQISQTPKGGREIAEAKKKAKSLTDQDFRNKARGAGGGTTAKLGGGTSRKSKQKAAQRQRQQARA